MSSVLQTCPIQDLQQSVYGKTESEISYNQMECQTPRRAIPSSSCNPSNSCIHTNNNVNLNLNHQRQQDYYDHAHTETFNDFKRHDFCDERKQNPELPIVACSQPPVPSLLTECQQSTGSLFSIVSAPPVPSTDLDIKQSDTLQPSIALQMGGSAQSPIVNRNSEMSIDMVETIAKASPSALGSTNSIIQRRPCFLPIETAYGSAPAASTGRTLHASLLEHQISEIEEEDNENLLTVSSITARPLIAKSNELRSHRNLNYDNNNKLNDNNNKRGLCRSIKQLKNPAEKRTIRSGVIKSTQRTNGVSSRSSVNLDPPDGGYGWFIVFGAFSVQFWVAGLVKSYGVLYVEIMETFPSSTATVASWIPAVLSALCLALAPLSSALCQRFSCRSVVFVGGLFCAMGMTLSYFATSLLHLLLTFGILTGIGGGLSTTPGIVIVSQYFDKHRALANGICVSGTATGSFILPVLIKHLAENFGFHGTILILGFCMLDVCMSALLYRSLPVHFEDDVNDNDNDNRTKVIEKKQATENVINSSKVDMLTNSTYLEACDEDGLNSKFIEYLFMEESKNCLNEYYNLKNSATEKSVPSYAQESDDEIKDIIGETTFIKPIKKVRSSGIMHSVEDLSTNSTWVYRKNSGTDSNRGSRRKRNIFANDEIISKIRAHLDKPISPTSVHMPAPAAVPGLVRTLASTADAPQTPPDVTRVLSKSMEIPTAPPSSNLNDSKPLEKNPNGSIIQVNSIIEEEIDEEDISNDNKSATCYERIEIYLDISLLKDPTFILMCLSVTLMSVGCPYMLYYLPAHVISIGYNKSEAGYLVAVSAVLDLCGRLGLGWLSDLHLFNRRKTYIICILGAGLAVLTIPSESTIYLVGLSAALYGFCLGSWYVLMPVLLADIFGTDRISSSYGLVRMFQSVGAISVPPLAGFLRDLYGNYGIVFYCMGSSMVMGSLPLLIWAILEYREQKLYKNRNNCDDISSVSVS